MQHGTQNYVLTGYGSMESAWVREFFNLFKREQVNIRKVVLLKNGDPKVFAMLEIQFVIQPGQDGFMSNLNRHLDKLSWQEKTLLPA
jgi:hypothetical protein